GGGDGLCGRGIRRRRADPRRRSVAGRARIAPQPAAQAVPRGAGSGDRRGARHRGRDRCDRPSRRRARRRRRDPRRPGAGTQADGGVAVRRRPRDRRRRRTVDGRAGLATMTRASAAKLVERIGMDASFPALASLAPRCGDLAREPGETHGQTLGDLYSGVGCSVAPDPGAEAGPSADHRGQSAMARAEWGNTCGWYVQAIRARVAATPGDAAIARRKIGPGFTGSPREVARRWAESVRYYRATLATVRKLDG